MNGFIKIHRSLLEWEWWDDKNTFRLFMTILLLANWKDKRWHGKVIPRGSFWTSLETLSKKSGLTLKQTRTSLNKLIATGEVTSKGANDGRLITVAKYDFYQSDDRKRASDGASEWADEGQTRGKRRATTEEREELLRRGEKEESDLLFFADID
jgi:hypothetical protein